MMDMNISALSRAYGSKILRPAQVLEEIFRRCGQFTSHNIWIYRLSMNELQPYLERLEKFSPDQLPLYGIPFAIKDNIDLAGIPTTAACREFSYVPKASAAVVQQLLDAGALPIGKTNMDQFATGLVGTRSPWGACGNAFDPRYISGGSSSGSAVATALGMVSFALGTDTAGSGRVPAALNNLIGVKPSKGLVSMRGVVPACRSLDCVSLFALTTDDANRVLDIMIRPDDADDYSRVNPFANSTRHYGASPGGFTFGVPHVSQLEFFGNDSAWRLFKSTVEKMESLGGRSVEIDFSPFLEAARLLYEGPWVAERYVAIESIITAQPDVLLPVIRQIIGSAQNKTAMDVFRAQYRLQHHHREAHRILQTVDFLLTPTTGSAYTIEEVNRNPLQLNSHLGYYTNFMNLLDCAAVAVPAGFLDNGVPWGISLVAPAFRDRRLLSFANAFQQHLALCPGAMQHPLSASTASAQPDAGRESIPVVVCGAHLDGLPLNWQLRERSARLALKTTTSDSYRLFALPGGPPYRPALLRDESGGALIEVEVWELPAVEFGSFVAGIPAPLGIGKVELADGRWLPGFICEPRAVEGATEITSFGGWRAYLEASRA